MIVIGNWAVGSIVRKLIIGTNDVVIPGNLFVSLWQFLGQSILPVPPDAARLSKSKAAHKLLPWDITRYICYIQQFYGSVHSYTVYKQDVHKFEFKMYQLSVRSEESNVKNSS